MSDFEFPMYADFDLTNFDIDFDIAESCFDVINEAPELLKQREFTKQKSTLCKRKKIETALTEISSVDEKAPMLMRSLFAPSLSKYPRMESIETFSYDFLYCVNSSNFAALQYLFSLHMDPSCEVSFSYTKQKLSWNKFLVLNELIYSVHPDRILVAQKREVESNKISCETIVSFTDCLPVYNAIAGTVKDPELLPFFPASRAEMLKRKMMISYRPKAIQENFKSLLESDLDLVIYGMLKFELVTDPMTQKGVSLHIDTDFHSVHAVEKNYY